MEDRGESGPQRNNWLNRFLNNFRKEQRSLSNGSNLTLRFEDHQITSDNREAKRRDLEQQLLEAFKLGQRNVFFMENVGGTDQEQEYFDRGLKLYDSFSKAAVYASLRQLDRKEPSPRDIDRTLKQFMIQYATHPVFGILTVVYEALDNLKVKGYDISLVFERGVEARPSLPDSTRYDMSSLREIKRYTNDLAGNTVSRNSIAREQIVNLWNRNMKANIFVYMGLLHSDITDLLPEGMRQQSRASAESFSESAFLSNTDARAVALIVNKLVRGLPVPKEEWRRFKHTKE